MIYKKSFFLFLICAAPFLLLAQGVDPEFTAAIKDLEKENVKIPENGILVFINTDLSTSQESSILNEHLNNGMAVARQIIYTSSFFENSSFYKKLLEQQYAMQHVSAKKLSEFIKKVTKRPGPGVVYLNGKDIRFVVKVD